MQPLYSHENVYTRAKQGFFLVLVVMLAGTVGFYFIGHGTWSLEKCLYMTVITVSTVGYGEVVPLDQVAHARIFAIFLILFGMGSMMFFGSTIVALFVEKDIGKAWRERKMDRQIANLEDHVIVCGAGTVGKQVVMELLATKTPFVIIESETQRIDEIRAEYDIKNPLHLIGDGTDGEVLVQAGIARARGIIITLPSDKDSLITTVTARQMNAKLRIVSRCHEPENVQRIIKAGADSVISPNVIGGMRLVSEMIRPSVVEFLDLMLKDKDKNLRIEEIAIPEDSDLVGKKLHEAWIRKITSLLVIAVKNVEKDTYAYNPGPDHVIDKGEILIVLGTTEDVNKLRDKMSE